MLSPSNASSAITTDHSRDVVTTWLFFIAIPMTLGINVMVAMTLGGRGDEAV